MRQQVAAWETAETEREETQEALRRSLEETARNKRLLLALNQAAQAVQRARTPEAVYEAVGEQVTRLGFDAAIFTLSDDDTYLSLSYLTLKSVLVRAVEKLTGLTSEGFVIPLLPGGLFQQIVFSSETVFLQQLGNSPFTEVLPPSVRPLVGRIVALIGWRQAIYAPLITGSEVVGLLLVAGTDLLQSDTPAITAFANQTAIAIDNARLYEEMQRLAAFNEGIIESMAEGIVVQDAEGVFTFANPAAAMMLGYALDELVGLHWTDIIPPDQRPIVEAVDERRKRGVADRYEVELLRKDSQRVSSLTSGSPRFDANGVFAGTMAVFTDITERKHAEKLLKQSEERLRLIVESTLDVFVLMDLQGKFLYYSGPALYGLTPEALIGKSAVDFVDPETHDKTIAAIERVLATGKHDAYENSVVWQGQTIWFLDETWPVRDEHGRIVAVSRISRNITERKQAEEARERLAAQVQEQAQQVEQILATVPAGVLLIDAEGRILQANPASQTHLLVLVGPNTGDMLTHLGDRSLTELLTSPQRRGLWHEVKAHEHTFEVIARPVEIVLNWKDEYESRPQHWVLVTNEVTRERQIQAQLQQQERLAALGQLAAGIAHDFNNVMASIVLYAQMIARSLTLSMQERERIAIIIQQAWHATGLIQQILDFSRRAVLERHPLDLLPLFKEQVKLLERTLPENIEITLKYGLEEYVVHADPTRMQQMLTNLAVNARDAMPGGGRLCIELARYDGAPGQTPPLPELGTGRWVRLTVVDTGAGIAPEVFSHLFEPFYTTKGPGGGTGLGLAQVHGIVGLHGGHIDVQTRVGEGTQFMIYLPAIDLRPLDPPLQTVYTIMQGNREVILLVEDDAALRTALAEMLEMLNYQTRQVANGREALELLETQGDQIALVLSDVIMPGMGGLALFHALRDKGWRTPVILLTGHPMDRELAALQEQGLDSWLSKPPDMVKLGHAIATALCAASEKT